MAASRRLFIRFLPLLIARGLATEVTDIDTLNTAIENLTYENSKLMAYMDALESKNAAMLENLDKKQALLEFNFVALESNLAALQLEFHAPLLSGGGWI